MLDYSINEISADQKGQSSHTQYGQWPLMIIRGRWESPDYHWVAGFVSILLHYSMGQSACVCLCWSAVWLFGREWMKFCPRNQY